MIESGLNSPFNEYHEIKLLLWWILHKIIFNKVVNFIISVAFLLILMIADKSEIELKTGL